MISILPKYSGCLLKMLINKIVCKTFALKNFIMNKAIFQEFAYSESKNKTTSINRPESICRFYLAGE